MENQPTLKEQLEYTRKRFRGAKGFDLNLDHPRYFSEKMQWRKFNDHNPLFPIVGDKLRIYDYLRLIDSPIMPPKLLAVSTTGELPNGLPDKWIAKANHGSGWNVTYEDPNPVPKLKSWLNQRYAPIAAEWGYQDISPAIVFQEYLEGETDIKFFVFHGKTAFVQHNRYGEHPTFTNYDPEWNKLNVHYVYPPGEATARPSNFDEMKSVAEWLGRPFDFARIDLMVTDKIHLGEITMYPTSGFAIIKPLDFDLWLGDQWTLPQ